MNTKTESNSDEPAFCLQNRPARSTRQPFVPTIERGPQRVLFAGLDCLAGQQDLFPTDGSTVEVE